MRFLRDSQLVHLVYSIPLTPTLTRTGQHWAKCTRDIQSAMFGPIVAGSFASDRRPGPNLRPIRVCVCHPSEWVANGLAVIHPDGFECVAVGGLRLHKLEAKFLASVRADVFLLGVPSDSSAEAASLHFDLMVRNCPRPLVALAERFSDYQVWRLEKLGFRGALEDAAATCENLRALLCAVAEGRRWFSAAFEERKRQLQNDSRAFPRLLTEQQENVLRCIALGYRNEEIGLHLQCSALTAKRHRADLMRKLDARDSLTLTRTARTLGFADFGLPSATKRTRSPAHHTCSANPSCQGRASSQLSLKALSCKP